MQNRIPRNKVTLLIHKRIFSSNKLLRSVVHTALFEEPSEKKNYYFFYGTLISGNCPYMILLIHYFSVYITKLEQLPTFIHFLFIMSQQRYRIARSMKSV